MLNILFTHKTTIMEKTVVLFEATNLDGNDYDAIMNELQTSGHLYDEKRLSHVSFNRNGTWCVVDVWESQEAFAEFAQNTLGPIFVKLGLNPPAPTVLPAHRYVGAHAEETISA